MSMDETRAGSSGLLIAQPLSGVRVLDLSRFPPGAYCTVLLGDLGAEVCRVDAPGADLTRAGIGVGLGRGRRSAAIDLRHPQGPEVLRRVAGWADVLVENNRPGDMEARGYGYRQISAEHPRLVWCSITGFGQDGPYARYPGHDLTYTAQSGLLAAINPELPWHPQQVLALPIGAMLAASAITAALFDRERTGRGRWIDISLTEAATWLLTGSDRSLAEGSWIPVSASRRLYRCADGRYVTVAAQEPRTWAALCEGLGLPELAREGPLVVEHSAELEARLASAFATRPAAEWLTLLGPKGAAISIVNHGADVVSDPHVRTRESVVEIEGVPLPANPIRMGDRDGFHRATNTGAPPKVGADTSWLLSNAGFSTAEIDGLRSAGAVADAGSP